MKTTLVDPRHLMRFDFGDAHPFKVYRLGLFYDLCAHYKLLERQDVAIVPLREATEAEAMRFHSQGYLEALPRQHGDVGSQPVRPRARHDRQPGLS